ncbi:conserved exported hypothetical protein [Rubrivivax sp. A210]|uniref:DUF2145 domain-containing protein n=1 Tax=Rubrivivax sp. A210 TaxID=2772301 RepID=UPI00191ABB6A|nr:DUF2145 domain-containing protein [Rubrivivax sp. A210]CAD5371675.1 conserved exported hypothetical protein [Rubrivivax sp. A210]
MKRRLAALCTALALAAAAPARAGRNCEARLPDATAVQRSLQLAERAARALDASGADVVVLARAGQDLSKYRLRWSHLGLAYRDQGQWRVLHKLNQCGSARAELWRQGLGEFFLDDLHEYRAAYALPTPAVQAGLRALLADNRRIAALHTGAYNMVAYPWAQKYQQSNQWAIETLAWSQEPAAATRERAQAWLRFKGYEPTVLRISPLVRLGARMTAAHIAFDDHPDDKRYSDRIETVTVDSVFDWLERAGLAGAPQELR